jgi:hypothetical protein
MRAEHENVKFFIGHEVELTPAYKMKTLFVVGIQPVKQIEEQIAYCNNFKIEHLYFGANQSFSLPDINSHEIFYSWSNMIKYFLDRGHWCTLDLNVKYIEVLHESGLCEYNSFIPMISVPVPHIRLLNYNATIKIDDRSMAASNPGVWCHSLHDLQKREVFTDWSKYFQDKVVNYD